MFLALSNGLATKVVQVVQHPIETKLIEPDLCFLLLFSLWDRSRTSPPQSIIEEIPGMGISPLVPFRDWCTETHDCRSAIADKDAAVGPGSRPHRDGLRLRPSHSVANTVMGWRHLSRRHYQLMLARSHGAAPPRRVNNQNQDLRHPYQF